LYDQHYYMRRGFLNRYRSRAGKNSYLLR